MGEGGEDVVVDGVDVVEVVLQQPDDVVPLGQVAGEYAVEIEQAQGVGEPFACVEKLEKLGAVGGVLLEVVV